MAALDAATPSDLVAIAHGMIMMAAQGGFTELLNVSEVVQREARQGLGLNLVDELRAAGRLSDAGPAPAHPVVLGAGVRNPSPSRP